MVRSSNLILGDFKNVARDPMLTYLPFIPFFLTVTLRLAIPWLNSVVKMDLTFHYDFIAGFLLLLTPFMVGMMAGFVLLDERDENILLTIAVTPLGRSGFLLYRLSMAVVLSFVLDTLLIPALGLVTFRATALIPVALVASSEAPLIALFMATFAENKVAGLVLAKACGVLLLAPLAILFIPGGWQLAAGILPTYWVTRSFIAIYRPELGYGLSLVIGVICHGLLFWLLLHLFGRRNE